VADEPGYDNLARALLEGQGFIWPGRVPLYPLWLAALHVITGHSYARMIYVQCVVGALGVWLTYVLGRELFGRSAGTLAALGTAVDIALVHQSVRLLSEVLFVPLVLLVALSLTRALSGAGARAAVQAGIFIGIANLIRPTLVFFPIVAAGLLLASQRPRLAGPWRSPCLPLRAS
jgi:4-amino-4-deoxy-L-arabinose transferase-like glycosyltransferase